MGLVAAITMMMSLGIGPDFIPIDSPVADPGGVLAAADREALQAELRQMQAELKVQMAIVVIDSVDGRPIEDWGIQLFERWQLGTAGNDDGLLAILVMDDRLSRLEVGYGLEPWIPDSSAKIMLDAMRDDLRAGDVAGALSGLVDDVRGMISDYAPGVPPPAPPLGTRPALPLVVTIFGLAAGIGLVTLRRRLDPLEKKLAKRAQLDPLLVRPAQRIALARKLLPWVVWGVFALLVMLIFRRGNGFWYAYAGLYLLWTVPAFAMDYTARRSVAGIVVYGLIVLALLVLWFGEGLDAPWSSGGDMFSSTVPMWFLTMFAWLFGLMLFSKHTGSGSRGGSYSSGSSYSRGSSSSSSSSSSSYSSRSSSSGGYSGGGGRSGGGGATSSW